MENALKDTSGSTLAGAAILLELAAEYGIFDRLRDRDGIDAAALAGSGCLSEGQAEHYLKALASAGLMTASGSAASTRYRPADDLDDIINHVGYLSWGLRACNPLIENAGAFAASMPDAMPRYPRSGRLVARTSRWMGEQSFYPQAEHAIISLRPRRIVDLGAGSAGLLIRCLGQLPADSQGVAVDISPAACEQARAAAQEAGMAGRITVVESPIQRLAEDPTPMQGADVIHAGFVFHDLMPDDEAVLDALLVACRQAAGSGTLLVVDAVPYAAATHERSFSAAFTFLHEAFMGRVLQTEDQWRRRLLKAGFANVRIEPLGIPGGRLFAASAA